MGPRVGLRTGDDAIEIIGITLCFCQSLTAAGRAAIPIGVLRAAAVKRLDYRLCLNSHFVFGSIREVDEFFRMTERKAPSSPNMSGIRRARGIATLQRLSHCRVADQSGPASITDRLKLAIPIRRRKPDFVLDVR